MDYELEPNRIKINRTVTLKNIVLALAIIPWPLLWHAIHGFKKLSESGSIIQLSLLMLQLIFFGAYLFLEALYHKWYLQHINAIINPEWFKIINDPEHKWPKP